jgi:hypothetical protein
MEYDPSGTAAHRRGIAAQATYPPARNYHILARFRTCSRTLSATQLLLAAGRGSTPTPSTLPETRGYRVGGEFRERVLAQGDSRSTDFYRASAGAQGGGRSSNVRVSL